MCSCRGLRPCRPGRVGGYAADAVVVVGFVFAPDDLAVNHHRVDGEVN